VTAQVALAVVLLVSASLLVQSLSNALRADLGFGAREAVLASVELPLTDFSPAQGAAYYDAAVARVRAFPGIEAASLVRTLPLSGGSRRRFHIDGHQPRPGEDMELPFNIVAPGYFETMKTAVLSGRTFDGRDRAGATPVAVVNEVLARRYFGGEATGRRLTDSSGQILQIVGVVQSGKYRTVQEPEPPFVYYPLSQSYSPRMTIVARTGHDAAAHTERLRRALREVHSGVAVFRTTTLTAHVEEALTGDKLTATLVGVCAAMALVLAVVGIYGVIAYGVLRRTREIGVRMALGAQRRHVVCLVVGEGVRLTAVGIAIGLIASAAAGRLLATMLYGVGPMDASTYAAAPAALAIVALIAACAPASRALSVDPIAVLRQD
jgi:predicted permease